MGIQSSINSALLSAASLIDNKIKMKQREAIAQNKKDNNPSNNQSYISMRNAQQARQRLEEQENIEAAQKEALNNRLEFLRNKVVNKNLSPEEQSKALQQLIEERKKGGVK